MSCLIFSWGVGDVSNSRIKASPLSYPNISAIKSGLSPPRCEKPYAPLEICLNTSLSLPYFASIQSNDNFEWILETANQGLPESQNLLGTMYLKGKEVNKDYEKAFYWFIKSAKGGSDQALYNIGSMYYNGYGTKQDYVKAFEYYRKAASYGNKDAQNEILNIEEKDINWHIKAANQGLAPAQYNLGLMYANGQGVAQSYAKAFEWYSKAAAQGNASAQNNLATMYVGGQGIVQNSALANEWLLKAANNGNAMAQFNIGQNYLYGNNGLPKNRTQALNWLRKASNNGHAQAKLMLAGLQ